MVRQTIPDIDFDHFVVGELKDLLATNKIKINPEYQRSSVWKHKQKIELIRSIENSYSIGVLVLFVNSDRQFEILDGQQRLLAVNDYVNNNLDLRNTGIKKYSDLTNREKISFDAYCIHYLKLKNFTEETMEEDIIQTFLRLQEGTPLNKAEKINAHRGEFKNTFRKLREGHQFFSMLGKEKRFRWRLLAAEFLLLELESDFQNKLFPDMGLDSFEKILKKYENSVSDSKITNVKGNLDLLTNSLNVMLSALQPRELISFYLLMSYLRKTKSDNSKLINEFQNFAEDFLKNVNSFSVYDTKSPVGMSVKLFKKYRAYKEESRKATTPDSFKIRFEFLLEEFKRLYPYIGKDKDRLHDTEQKRILYFRQKGICLECKKKFRFEEGTGHHVIAHSSGGKTDDLDHGVLLHRRCHDKLEKRLKDA